LETCKELENEEKTFVNFYFAITEKVGVPYYDQQSFAALRDTNTDESWRWNRDSTLQFWYQPSIPSRNANLASTKRNCLHIVSTIPERFVYLNKAEKIIPLLLLVLLFIAALYKWLGRNTKRIFLTRYVDSPSLKDTHEKKGLIAAYFEGKPNPEDDIARRTYSTANSTEY